MSEIPKYRGWGWGRERFVRLENGHFASVTNAITNRQSPFSFQRKPNSNNYTNIFFKVIDIEQKDMSRNLL